MFEHLGAMTLALTGNGDGNRIVNDCASGPLPAYPPGQRL